jgi:hypothetical protein
MRSLNNMKTVLGDLNGKISKQTIWNEHLHEIGNANGVNVVNSAILKVLRIKSMMFAHRNIHKYSYMSPGGKTNNQTDHILIDRRDLSSVLDVRSFRVADSDTDHSLSYGSNKS